MKDKGGAIALAVVLSAVVIFVVVMRWTMTPKQREKDCMANDYAACGNLAESYEHGTNGLPKDEHKAFELYKKMCDGKNAWGCGSLGYYYAHGPVVPIDYAKALELDTFSCNEHIAIGCYGLGELYRDGHGTAVDKKKAQGLFAFACSHSHSGGRNSHASPDDWGCREEHALDAELGEHP